MTAPRKRGRPRKSANVRTPAALELPALPVVDAPAPFATDDALAALAIADREPAENGNGKAPASPVPPSPDTPAAVDVGAPAVARVPLEHATPATPATPRPKERSITGRQYSGLDRKQLRTALAIAENKNAELETRLREIVPAATAAKVVALEKMTGVVVSALFDFAALATSVDEVRLDRDEERELGELGAPAIAPYLGEYGKHAPLIAFGAKLATVITTKVIIAKTVKEQHAAGNGA